MRCHQTKDAATEHAFDIKYRDDVCGALSRELVLSTCRLAVKMHMQTIYMWPELPYCSR